MSNPLKNLTLIEQCCLGWMIAVLAGVLFFTVSAFAGTDTATTADVLQDVAHEIQDNGGMASVVAGLILLLGMLVRQPWFRSLFPLVAEYITEAIASRLEARRRRKAKRKQHETK